MEKVFVIYESVVLMKCFFDVVKWVFFILEICVEWWYIDGGVFDFGVVIDKGYFCLGNIKYKI